MRILRSLLVLGAVALSSGCYRWIPAEPGSVPTGALVRAYLTDSGVVEARRTFGPGTGTVEGPLVGWDGSGFSLLVQSSLQRPGFPPTTLTDTVRFQSAHLAEMEMRELNGTRTLLLGVGLAGLGVAALLVAQSVGGESGQPGEGEGPPIEDAVVFRIPFGFGIR